MKELDLTYVRPANRKRVEQCYNEHKSNILEAEELLASGRYDSLLSISKYIGIDDQYNKFYKAFKKWGNYNITSKSNGKQLMTKRELSSRAKIPLNNNIEELYEGGATLKDIGILFNVSAATVMSYMKKNNMPRRSKSTITTAMNARPGVKSAQRIRGIESYLNRRFTGTKPEQIFECWLKSKNISFEQQYRKIGNGHPYDFFLNDYNLLVEIDGHYWHDKPEQKVKDKKHVDDAKDKGYNIIRISTRDFNKEKDFSKWIKI